MNNKTLRSLLIAFAFGFFGALAGWLLGRALHLSYMGRLLLTSGIIGLMVALGVILTLRKSMPKS